MCTVILWSLPQSVKGCVKKMHQRWTENKITSFLILKVNFTIVPETRKDMLITRLLYHQQNDGLSNSYSFI